MDYAFLETKEKPFDGLDEISRRKFLVYLCYVKNPVVPIEEINKKWGDISVMLPPIFEANQIAAEIRKEIAKSSMMVEGSEKNKFLERGCFVKIIFLILIVTVVVVLLTCGHDKNTLCAKKELLESEQTDRICREQAEKERRDREERIARERADRIRSEQAEKERRDREERIARERADRIRREQLEKTERMKRAQEEKIKHERFMSSLSDLEERATKLLLDNDRWFSWNVDKNALVSMGDELCEAYNNYEHLFSGEHVVDSKNKISKLTEIIVRCYGLASDNGSGEASFKLCLLYGGANNLIPYSGLVVRDDSALASKYLKHAIDKKVDGALELLKNMRYVETNESQKKMISAADAARSVYAEIFASKEWDKGVDAWRKGNDYCDSEDYESATAEYLLAYNHFLKGESIAKEELKEEHGIYLNSRPVYPKPEVRRKCTMCDGTGTLQSKRYKLVNGKQYVSERVKERCRECKGKGYW